MPGNECKRVDFVIAKCGCHFDELQFAGKLQIFLLDIERTHDQLSSAACAGARVANVDALALDVGERFDIGILPCDQCEQLRVDRKQRAQFWLRLVFKSAGTSHGVILRVALGEADVHVATHHGIDIEHRAAGGFYGATQSVILAVGVDEPADRATQRVIDADDTAGANGDEFRLLRDGWCAHARQTTSQ